MKRILLHCFILLSVVITGFAQAQVPSVVPFSEPAISPDGMEIAFVSGGDIWTVPAWGGAAHLLIANPAHDNRPVYSPDGKSLAFMSNRSGNSNIYIVNIESGALKRLTFTDAKDELDGFSSDGKWVYFSTTSTDIGGANHDIYRVSADGGTPMPVIADRYNNEFNAAPSPDGTKLAFIAGGIVAREWYRKGHSHGGDCAIWMISAGKNAAGDQPEFKQLTPDGSRDLWPMWSGDGQVLYYISDRDGLQNIMFRSLKDSVTEVGMTLTNFK